ncbi:unnamed protein product [Trichogramma brassicae]|uniref:Secreted protein n=1 Tax=Trichogramma brassicae TaxID=86971 RepID=A0A6H5I4V4_9HYME|nr:unnamed protein product [Trichogramma brassicae]
MIFVLRMILCLIITVFSTEELTDVDLSLTRLLQLNSTSANLYNKDSSSTSHQPLSEARLICLRIGVNSSIATSKRITLCIRTSLERLHKSLKLLCLESHYVKIPDGPVGLVAWSSRPLRSRGYCTSSSGLASQTPFDVTDLFYCRDLSGPCSGRDGHVLLMAAL